MELTLTLNQQYLTNKPYLYLVTIKKVGESLHDAGRDHKDCADTDADDDVVIRLVLVSSCACQHLEEHVSGYDLVSYNIKC